MHDDGLAWSDRGLSVAILMKTKRNLKLLRKVRDAILEHHDQFVMSSYFDIFNCIGKEAGGCGTAACIAGWTIHLSQNKKTIYESRRHGPDNRTAAAMAELGISKPEAHSLFHLSYWPLQFIDQYWAVNTTHGRAKVAADRIDYFIETGL